jgi:hypothetical protein
MRALLFAAPAALLIAVTPASAASFISGPGSVTLDRADDFTWTVAYAATAGDGLAGTTGSILFNFLSANAAGTTWNFSYVVDNTSTALSPGSELSSFGFDTSGTESRVTSGAGNLFRAALGTGNFNGLGGRDVCLYAGPNCNGGGSNGVGSSQTPVSGTFALEFGSGVSTLVFDDFVARWQSTGANGNGSASGPGTVMGAVPEPATWAMMLLGFGAVGYSMRRRKATVHLGYAV